MMPTEIHFMAVRHSRSTDGGVTTTSDHPAGWDHHDMWIDPENPDRMIVGHDGGISISTTRGRSWFKPQLPIAQIYHAHVDDRIPYFVYGNRQDGPSTHGPSNTLSGGAIPIGAWSSVGGCETGFAIPNPADPNIVWAGCYDGMLELYDARTDHVRDVSIWPAAAESWPAAELDYRFQWTFPIAISPHDPDRVLAGSQYVHQTLDQGQSWSVISPDLTTDDPELQQRTGGLTLDDAGPTVGPAVFALAVSPLEEDVIWAGTNDGRVHVTRQGGGTWSDVTANLTDLPPRGTISNIEPSRHAPGAAYLTVDRHQLGDTATYVYKTTDYGATWRLINAGIPQSILGYAHCVREDPKRPGLLYLGVENGIYVSFSDGERWRPLQSNLPHAPVHWLTIQERFNDLVVATYGRGFWILDDLSPLQQIDPDELGDEPELFEPRPAYRFHRREPSMMQPDDPAAGSNPTYGASIHYYLGPSNGKSAPAASDSSAGATETSADPAPTEFVEETDASVEISILDASGQTVRILENLSGRPGLHRVFWDLELERTVEVKLRTRPAENPHVTVSEKGWRSLVDGGRFTVLAPPGVYTLQLTVDGTTMTHPLTVLKDPGAAGSADDLRAQLDVVMDLRDMIDEVAMMINELEWTRKQLIDLEERLADSTLADQPKLSDVFTASATLAGELEELEGQFFDLRMTQASQDTLRWKRLLYSRLIYLGWSLTRADFPPTTQQMKVFRELERELGARRRRFEELRDRQVPAFNELLRKQGIPSVILG